MLDVDLTASPRVVTTEWPIPLSGIDAALCHADGIYLYKGSQYYHYETARILAVARIAPRPKPITSAMMGCKD